MNPIALLLLAFAMSTDAFAAAIGKGASLKKPSFSEALRMGVIFGSIEAITPVIGWLIGKSASSYVETWAHWIAFFLLVVLGLYMIYEGMKPVSEEVEKPSSHSFLKVSLTAIGTSIDAMAVGVGLAFINVNILIAAALIGLATTFMVTLGVIVRANYWFRIGTQSGSFWRPYAHSGRRMDIVGALVALKKQTSLWLNSGGMSAR